tara:strand:+ start:1725 stop:2447 length:723 start_codon:yes stop_codon:yes gene_type:complete
MDRTLSVDTPLAIFGRKSTAPTEYEETAATGYVPIDTANNIFLYESTIDIGGYTRQDDFTAFFRSSFEQTGGVYFCTWAVISADLSPVDAVISEQVIISSVPLTNTQLISSFVDSPGFSGITTTTSDAFRTGNRETVIHGHRYDHALSTTFGADPLSANGRGYMIPVNKNVYSSLEPTAADTLFVYRLFLLPETTVPLKAGLSTIAVPSRRIILDAMFDKEDNIPHLMRLKRSYELANQV